MVGRRHSSASVHSQLISDDKSSVSDVLPEDLPSDISLLDRNFIHPLLEDLEAPQLMMREIDTYPLTTAGGPSGRRKNGARRKLLQLGAQWQEEERSQEKAASAGGPVAGGRTEPGESCFS